MRRTGASVRAVAIAAVTFVSGWVVGSCSSGDGLLVSQEERVRTVAEAREILLDHPDAPIHRMVPTSVQVDLLRDGGEATVDALHLFFTDRDGHDAWCRFDNGEGTLVCSEDYSSPPLPEGVEPIDLGTVAVSPLEALELADEEVRSGIAGQSPPDLLVDLVLRETGGGPIWRVSYDLWTEAGPEAVASVDVDAATGEVVASETRPATISDPETR